MNIIHDREYNESVHSAYTRYAAIRMQPTKFSPQPIPTVTWVLYADEDPRNLPEFSSLEFIEIDKTAQCQVGYVKHNGALVPLENVATEIFSTEELKNYLRAQRNMLLNQCDWYVTRHITQQATQGVTPSLTNEQYTQLLNYMQALRDLPNTTTDYLNPTWPEKPSFLP